MEVRLYFANQAWKKNRAFKVYITSNSLLLSVVQHTEPGSWSWQSCNIRHKSWNTCVIFSFSDVDLGTTVVSVLQLVRVAQHWGRKGANWVRKKVRRVNVRNLEKIQEKQLLFQRFVTSIVDCGILAGYIRQGLPGFWGIQYIGVFNFRYTVFLCLNLGIKYSVTTTCCIKYTMFFLILVFYTSFSIIFWYFGRYISGILVFQRPPPPFPPGWP